MKNGMVYVDGTMVYKYDDYRMIEAHTNYTNYILIKSYETDEIIIVDWDLSEDEVDQLRMKFERDELTDEDIQGDETLDSLDGFNGFTVIA